MHLSPPLFLSLCLSFSCPLLLSQSLSKAVMSLHHSFISTSIFISPLHLSVYFPSFYPCLHLSCSMHTVKFHPFFLLVFRSSVAPRLFPCDFCIRMNKEIVLDWLLFFIDKWKELYYVCTHTPTYISYKSILLIQGAIVLLPLLLTDRGTNEDWKLLWLYSLIPIIYIHINI